ncbi:hypothetical protein EKO04_008067 [Ascochyta lentis]|uniref:Protein-S-isoprenylcysteine O-methyltransferase n=1 Tax=Ascochyta lentis TaxID=205686 RepID=A0A8H7J2K2_9PLEO|nr:hypothetical protein EKO04_008067 [Ascochyta lentis]
MASVIPTLFVAFLMEQLYALNFHFPHPPSGLVYPHSIQLLKTLSVSAALAAWRSIMKLSPSAPAYSTIPISLFFLTSLGLFAWVATEARPRQLSVIYGRVTPTHVLSSGPFAVVRHPTYVAYALGWVGVAVHVLVTGDTGEARDGTWVSAPAWIAILVASVLGLFGLYRRGAVLEELQFLKSQGTVVDEKVEEGVRVDYLAYMRKVPYRWLPGVA